MIQRKRLSAKTKAAIVARQKGYCAAGLCISTGPFEYDHVVALELGGKDHPDNIQALCVYHHKQKTRADVKAIAKGRRLRAKAAGTWRPNRKRLRSPGFNSNFTRELRTGKTKRREGRAHMA